METWPVGAHERQRGKHKHLLEQDKKILFHFHSQGPSCAATWCSHNINCSVFGRIRLMEWIKLKDGIEGSALYLGAFFFVCLYQNVLEYGHTLQNNILLYPVVWILVLSHSSHFLNCLLITSTSICNQLTTEMFADLIYTHNMSKLSQVQSSTHRKDPHTVRRLTSTKKII